MFFTFLHKDRYCWPLAAIQMLHLALTAHIAAKYYFGDIWCIAADSVFSGFLNRLATNF